jgi:hypothetical protein
MVALVGREVVAMYEIAMHTNDCAVYDCAIFEFDSDGLVCEFHQESDTCDTTQSSR